MAFQKASIFNSCKAGRASKPGDLKLDSETRMKLFRFIMVVVLCSIMVFSNCQENPEENQDFRVSPNAKMDSNREDSFPIDKNLPKPDESGAIPIIAYHKVGDEDTEYTRSHSGLREDMLRIIQEGLYPISLEEFRTGRIQAPRGKIPVLISFDDSSISQFEMDEKGNILPNSAIGILEKIRKDSPGFHAKAVFFVLPGAKSPNNFFGQIPLQKAKAEFLVENGYSIENHTFWHANLKQYSRLIEEQIAKTKSFVRELVPDYEMTTLALPFGIYPPESERNRLLSGSYKGQEYTNELIFDFSNRFSLSPYSKEFNPLYVRRLHGNKKQMEKLFRDIKKPGFAFISDGDPNRITVPKGKEESIAPKWKESLTVYNSDL